MTGIKSALVAMILLIASDGFAAATTESRYQRLWGKSVGSKEKPKVACVCLATSELGAVIFIPGPSQAFVYCGIPSFNPDGSLNASLNCGGNFAVLPK